MSDYPKVIEVDGVKFTVSDAADEARWRGQPTPSEYPKVIQAGEFSVSVADAKQEASWLASPIPPIIVSSPEPVPEPEPEPEPAVAAPSTPARLVKHPVKAVTAHKGMKKK